MWQAARIRFFVAQCFAIALVACDNQSRFSAHAKTSVAATYFGVFGAGFPSGIKNLVATKGMMLRSWNPSSTATSEVFKRAGSRWQLSSAKASCGAVCSFSLASSGRLLGTPLLPHGPIGSFDLTGEIRAIHEDGILHAGTQGESQFRQTWNVVRQAKGNLDVFVLNQKRGQSLQIDNFGAAVREMVTAVPADFGMELDRAGSELIFGAEGSAAPL